MNMNIVVYKNGSFLTCEHSWEYENDPDWLVTIPVSDKSAKYKAGLEKIVKEGMFSLNRNQIVDWAKAALEAE